MKWYWVVLIIIGTALLGFLIANYFKKKEPMNGNGKMLTDGLKTELIGIDLFFQGRPNPEDPDYVALFDKNTARRAEILNILKGIYQCTDISFTGGQLSCIK